MDVVWSTTDNQAMLDTFLDDLYDTVECFRRSYQNQEFVYRIYYALSAGDFAIVIKSRTPELSFGISTYLRSRISEKKWAVYKTYTLLAMEDDIEGWENNSIRLSESGNIGKFVLRGCYSWKYWTEHLESENIAGIDRLNGRYDISAELTEQEFAALYHKVAGKDNGKDKIIDQAGGKVSYLAGLIDKKHLSYINERYLMRGIEISLEDTDTVSRLELDDKEGEELYYLNQKIIGTLREKQSSLEKEYAIVYREHKSLRHCFELLKRQIDFCSVLNEQSDTQIYASGMEQLLGAVLDSLEEYRNMYQKETEILSEHEGSQLGQLIVEYLGKSVYSINTYMEYVRNNNLQSLQTPNYNIESDMGMEKILIGYSEYLRELVSFYVKKSDCMKNNIGFLPIVVPGIGCSDIKVEALFPDDKVFRFAEETSEKSEKLLIINSPSMMELEDVPMAMAMLCHEIAHQFRYEGRKERNEILLQIFAVECAEVIAEKILAGLQAELGEVITFPPIKTILKQELSNTIKEVLTSPEYGVNMDSPLDHLTIELKSKLLDFFKDFSYISRLDKYIQLFIRQVNEWENVDVGDIDSIINLYDVVHPTKPEKPCLKKIEEAAEAYLSEMVKKGKDQKVIYLYMDDLIKQIAVEERSDIDTKAQEFITRMHKRLTDMWQKRTPKQAKRIGGDISASDYRMWGLAGRYLGVDIKLTKATEIYEKSRDRFLDVIKQVNFEEKDLETALTSIGIYREITSDIFMCCVMNLSPFAYLNVIVTNMWRADLIVNQGILYRIITVILTIGIHDKDCDAQQALEEYNKFCMGILDKIGVEIKEYIPEEYEEYENLIWGVKEEPGKKGEECSIHIEECRSKLECFRKKIEKKYKYKSDFFIKIDKILLVCGSMIGEGETYIDQLYRDAEYPQACDKEFLREDYYIAWQVLSEFREKMKDDKKMAQLDKLHQKISQYLERLYETGKVVDGDLNREGIEFLLKMYFNYKFQHAENGGDNNEDKDICS